MLAVRKKDIVTWQLPGVFGVKLMVPESCEVGGGLSKMVAFIGGGSLVLVNHIRPGSSVHGISQARILEWVAISFSRDLPDPGIKSGSPVLQVVSCMSDRFFTN